MPREGNELYLHGFCYKCLKRFLDNKTVCSTCRVLARRYKKAPFRFKSVRTIGPTELTTPLMDHLLNDKDHSEWIARECELTCWMYDRCLNYAGAQRWHSFSCRWCKVRGHVDMEQQKGVIVL